MDLELRNRLVHTYVGELMIASASWLRANEDVLSKHITTEWEWATLFDTAINEFIVAMAHAVDKSLDENPNDQLSLDDNDDIT